ncbi:homocitrate synthase [Clostridium puniceum]|uniref:Homocitrate synthase n=1 Tax=Clostridium puniceum TaxID=29367 RepID=A0A1S8T6T8_9CLOT|nr:isopropylmalate synthase [Clostridium puniceum]OOM73510.1 homocitrate synthase [Clostridium puniceum]
MKKIKIIDKTIVALKEVYGDKLIGKFFDIKELIKLLHIIGSDCIELTQELYRELSPLPQYIEFKIINGNIVESRTIRNKSVETRTSLIREIEIKEDYNPCSILKNKLSNNDFEDIRITGLQNVIFYDYQKIFSEIANVFNYDIEICIKNKYSAATAMTLEWIKFGGDTVVATFAGIGGYANLEEILGGLSFLEKKEHQGNYKFLPEVLNLFEKITESKLHANMPFIGRDIFNVESGIHVNGIAKNPATYEPYDPSEIGRKRNIIIGKHSGINALEIKLKELNIKYSSENLKFMLENVRKLSTQNRRGLNNEEIKEIYKKCSI